MQELLTKTSNTNGYSQFKPDFPITVQQALTALDNMDDYARMNTGVNAYGPVGALRAFIEQTHQKEEDKKLINHVTATLAQDLLAVHAALGFTTDDEPDADLMVERINNRRLAGEDSHKELVILMTMLQDIDIKCSGGLCQFSHGGTREYFYDIRKVIKDYFGSNGISV